MATVGSNCLTLADWAKRTGFDGRIATVIELLSQTNEILDDMLFKEGNLPVGERTVIRVGLPTAAWRLLNSGTQPSKSQTAQIDEQCGILEAWSEVDEDLAILNGDVSAFRLSEAYAFIEAMNIAMATAIFYGNSAVNPEQFTGLSPRYSAISGANNGKNVISGGGVSSDNMSIWLVCWGQQTIYGIFPKGSMAGLVHQDLGVETVETVAAVAGSRMRAYRDRWQWKCGIALKDWRYVVRICNIDTTALTTEVSPADIIKLMIRAVHRIHNLKLGRPVFYMNRTAAEMLDIFRYENVMTGGQLKYEDVDGKMQYSFRGIPIRICDTLTITEASIS